MMRSLYSLQFLVVFMLALIVMVLYPKQFDAGTMLQFQDGSFDDALELAKSENKYVFINTTSQQCGKCQTLPGTVFNVNDVVSFHDSHFVNYQIDVDDYRYGNFA
ncbi:MAG: thioredoxin family protein, partial [Chitinophagales bacterium]